MLLLLFVHGGHSAAQASGWLALCDVSRGSGLKNELIVVSACLPSPHTGAIIHTDIDDPRMLGFPFDLAEFLTLGASLCDSEKTLRYRNDVPRVPRVGVFIGTSGFAYAVWPSGYDTDWTILSSHLIEKLFATSIPLALHFSTTPIVEGEPNYLSKLKTLGAMSGFQELAVLLTKVAFVFVLGHEFGHHAFGHEYFYLPGASAAGAIHDEPGDADPDYDAAQDKNLHFHALELAADHHGATLVAEVLHLRPELLLRPNASTDVGVAQAELRDAGVTSFIACSALLNAFCALNARRWTAKDMHSGRHPLSAIRCRAMFDLMRKDTLAGNHSDSELVNEAAWSGIGMAASALSSAMVPPAVANATEEERRAHYEKHWKNALGQLGLQRAFFDEKNIGPYVAELERRWGKQREECAPKWRMADPLSLRSADQPSS